jgi:hypothetical protein
MLFHAEVFPVKKKIESQQFFVFSVALHVHWMLIIAVLLKTLQFFGIKGILLTQNNFTSGLATRNTTHIFLMNNKITIGTHTRMYCMRKI